MPPAHDLSPSGLTSLISAVVAPVALISANAILLSSFSAKYANLATQFRSLTAEFRNADTPDTRRRNIRQQLRLFHRRITAMWAASAFLSFSLLSFLVTVLALVLVQHALRITALGAASIVIGLVFVLCAILLELYETFLARLTVSGELADVFSSDDTSD